MGMYVCVNCAAEHKLALAFRFTNACCEICGPLKDDWSFKSLAWTSALDRNTWLSDKSEERRAEIRAALEAIHAERAAPTTSTGSPPSSAPAERADLPP